MPKTRLQLFSFVAIVSFVLLLDAVVASAQEWPEYTSPDGNPFDRGPGFYISWWKLLCCIPFFFFWVKAADWVNADIQRNRETTKMELDSWNPAVVFSFLGGFIALLCLPIFWIGFPIYAIASLLPYFLYLRARNPLLPKATRTIFPMHPDPLKQPAKVVLRQDEGLQLEIKAGGENSQRSQANLIAARQNPFFLQVKESLYDIMFKRAERVQLDYTQQAVAVRYEVDGVWINMPPRDRQSGDAILYAYKQLANLNPMDRQNRQEGSFEVASGKTKSRFELTSAGVQTGERVVLKVMELKKKAAMNIMQLGMLPDMYTQLQANLNRSGMVIISSLPSGGLSSSWLGALDAADRVTRDFVGVCDKNFQDKVIENVSFVEFDKAAGQTPLAELKNLALKLPDAYVVPELVDAETVNYLCDQIEKEKAFAITQIHAKSSVEAIVRTLMLNADRSKLAKSMNCVLFHKLFRRLCDQCKQAVQPPPQLLQQLGITPTPQTMFFQQYQPPAPETLVDEKGRPIAPPPPCRTCGGIGFYGRIAVFELLEINDKVRQAMVNSPTLKDIGAAAQMTGQKTVQQNAINLLVAGVTSLQEIQRVVNQ